ncbi:MAG: IS5/IS1182 family transposase [Bacteroidia bacterium]|nr:MAG: IS5/IS1182 family transposase [Bacteroidia bacterium]
MRGKSQDQEQRNLFRPILKEIINPEHELVKLADEIDWNYFETTFSDYYSTQGRPSVPVRTMVGLLLLKQMNNLGDETVIAAWLQNPYFQYFTGEREFQWNPPCNPTDFVHFRKRIGQAGAESILKASIAIRKDEIKGDDVIFDTTAQEKNITYPTDAKLLRKVIERCQNIARKEDIRLRQSYKRTIKSLLLKQRFAHHPKRKKEANAALRKMRTIAGRLVRELNRKLSKESIINYAQQLEIFHRIVTQKRTDKNKIYSIHEPQTACIAKGKAHKKFEFGSKVSVAILPKVNIIVGLTNFNGNPNDTSTLEEALKDVERYTEREFKNAIVDRGYKGKKQIGKTIIVSPKAPGEKQTYSPPTMRRKCRSRAAVEPVIGHLKSDCRMAKNYLKTVLTFIYFKIIDPPKLNWIILALLIDFLRID